MRAYLLLVPGLLVLHQANAQDVTATSVNQSVASPAFSVNTNGNATFNTISTAVLPAYGTVARTLASRFSDKLNVRDYGAKCDGSSDDTASFQQAIGVATGNITGNSAFSTAQQSQLSSLNGIGPNKNGAAEIIVPSGDCMLSTTLTVNTQSNSGFALIGSGTGLTHLVWSNSGDGIDINFKANSNGNDVSRTTSRPGQSLYIKGINFQTSFAGSNVGIALKITGIPLSNASQAPDQLLEDLVFDNRTGYEGMTQGWAGGLVFKDPDYLFMTRLRAIDHLSTPNLFGYQIVSDAPASGFPGHGNIVCQDCNQVGGTKFFDISGTGFQGITLERPFWITTQTGITWLAPSSSSSGSLYIENASGTSGIAVVHAQNIGTLFSKAGYYYPGNYTKAGTAWHGFWADGVSWTNETGDIVVAPPEGALAPALSYGSTVLQISGATGSQAYPNLISNVTVTGSDFGFSAQGQNTVVQDSSCLLNGPTSSPGVCFQNTNTGSDVTQNPTFKNMQASNQLDYADSSASSTIVHGSYTQYFGAGFELGMPGVTIPGNGLGLAGDIDWHSVSSSNGTISGLNDYDCRQNVTGGTSGSIGSGTMNIGCVVSVTGALTAPALVINGGQLNDTYGDIEDGGTNTGLLDFHQAGSTYDYDTRLVENTGSFTAAGQGGLTLVGTGGLTLSTGILTTQGINTPSVGVVGQNLQLPGTFVQAAGPVLTPALRLIGFVPPTSSTTSCSAGTSGDGVLSNTYYHFYCYANNQWGRVALQTTGW